MGSNARRRLRRKPTFVAVPVAAAAVVVAVTLPLLTDKRNERKVEAGAPTPSLAGTAVRGGKVNLTRLRGHVVLLSFLDLRADTAENGPSRAEIVFLRSMQTQHARFGLRVVLVDTARQSRNDLVNDTYDWNLSPAIAVVGDDGTLARRVGVHQAPTTFVIGRNGVVRRRWDGFARAAQLDFAIRAAEGRSPTG
jgi:peroxiredoxin